MGRTGRVGYPGVKHPTLTLDDAVDIASTGDIWLFRGRSAADLAIRAVTNSPVNHVGMVVAIDDLPPLLWHAELGRSLPDVWTGQRQRGVQLHHLREAVTTWNERYSQRAWVRQLEGTIERHHEDRLMEIIARFDGRAFPTTPGLIRQWAKARLRRTSSLETIYCAELVATTYQHMGLLPSHRPASWYDPGRSGAATTSSWSPRSLSPARSRCADAAFRGGGGCRARRHGCPTLGRSCARPAQ